MTLLDTLVQSVRSLSGGGKNDLLQAVLQMLDSGPNSTGGLTALVQSFQEKGLGELMKSWVSTEKNMPATPQQIQQGLGEQLVQQIANRAGLQPQETSRQLTQLLPKLIDQLTPQGQIPDTKMFSQEIQEIKKIFS